MNAPPKKKQIQRPELIEWSKNLPALVEAAFIRVEPDGAIFLSDIKIPYSRYKEDIVTDHCRIYFRYKETAEKIASLLTPGRKIQFVANTIEYQKQEYRGKLGVSSVRKMGFDKLYVPRIVILPIIGEDESVHILDYDETTIDGSVTMLYRTSTNRKIDCWAGISHSTQSMSGIMGKFRYQLPLTSSDLFSINLRVNLPYPNSYIKNDALRYADTTMEKEKRKIYATVDFYEAPPVELSKKHGIDSAVFTKHALEKMILNGVHNKTSINKGHYKCSIEDLYPGTLQRQIRVESNIRKQDKRQVTDLTQVQRALMEQLKTDSILENNNGPEIMKKTVDSLLDKAIKDTIALTNNYIKPTKQDSLRKKHINKVYETVKIPANHLFVRPGESVIEWDKYAIVLAEATINRYDYTSNKINISNISFPYAEVICDLPVKEDTKMTVSFSTDYVAKAAIKAVNTGERIRFFTHVKVEYIPQRSYIRCISGSNLECLHDLIILDPEVYSNIEYPMILLPTSLDGSNKLEWSKSVKFTKYEAYDFICKVPHSLYETPMNRSARRQQQRKQKVDIDIRVNEAKENYKIAEKEAKKQQKLANTTDN